MVSLPSSYYVPYDMQCEVWLCTVYLTVADLRTSVLFKHPDTSGVSSSSPHMVLVLVFQNLALAKIIGLYGMSYGCSCIQYSQFTQWWLSASCAYTLGLQVKGPEDTNTPVCGYSGAKNLFLHMHSVAFPTFKSLQHPSQTSAIFPSSVQFLSPAVTFGILI